MIQNITDAMICTFFPSYLEGDAEQWYYSVSDTMKTSVARIKDVLFTRYCPSKLSVELIDINQSEMETVDEYIHRVLKQCADTDMSDISKMTKAMKGLKPALGNIVIPQDPISMEDLRIRANRAELTLIVTKTPQAGDINAMFAELKADINSIKTGKEATIATMAEGGIHRAHQYQQQQWKGRNNFGQRFQQQPGYQHQPDFQQRPRFQQRTGFQQQPRFQQRPRFQKQQQVGEQWRPNNACQRCGEYSCNQYNCWAKFEMCVTCGKFGHIDKSCWRNKRQMNNQY